MQTPYLTFLLQGAWYAVEALRVKEILRLPALAPVIETPHYIIGVVNYRGHIVPVRDVEDSITTRTQEIRILESAGYDVVAAVNGIDALQKLASRAFDAVASEIEMPSMEGLTMIERIRREPKYNELPIILVTSLASEEDKRHGIEVGANAYFAPDMDGLKLTQEIMRRFPRPILVVSAAVHPEDAHNVFKLLEAGAIDVLPKPRGGLSADEPRVAEELIRKIKIISGVAVLPQSTNRRPSAVGHRHLHVGGALLWRGGHWRPADGHGKRWGRRYASDF
jgi:CheY-like chemotaxis protein